MGGRTRRLRNQARREAAKGVNAPLPKSSIAKQAKKTAAKKKSKGLKKVKGL
jgi:hypothetical protein